MGKKVKWVITSNINKSYCQHLKNLSGKLPRLHGENLVDKRIFLQSVYSHTTVNKENKLTLFPSFFNGISK